LIIFPTIASSAGAFGMMAGPAAAPISPPTLLFFACPGLATVPSGVGATAPGSTSCALAGGTPTAISAATPRTQARRAVRVPNPDPNIAIATPRPQPGPCPCGETRAIEAPAPSPSAVLPWTVRVRPWPAWRSQPSRGKEADSRCPDARFRGRESEG